MSVQRNFVCTVGMFVCNIHLIFVELVLSETQTIREVDIATTHLSVGNLIGLPPQFLCEEQLKALKFQAKPIVC